MTGVLDAVGVSVQYGAVTALSNVDITLRAGQVTGLIGPNGAGKTTLIDALMGFVPLSAGRVCLDGQDLNHVPPHRRVSLGLTRTFQSVELFEDMTVEENLDVAVGGRSHPDRQPTIEQLPAELRHLRTSVAGQLSPSQRKSVALSRALATAPRVLLLDEPAAGLDVAERRRLTATVRAIATSGVAVMIVDHDLALVLDACDEVVVLDLGRVVAVGTSSAVRDDPRVSGLYLGKTERSSHAKPQRSTSGGLAVAVEGLGASYNGRPAIRDITLQVGSGELVALLGPNGAGKTTTLLALSGAIPEVTGQGTIVGQRLGTRAHRLAKRGVAHVLQSGKVFGNLSTAENLRLAAPTRRNIDEALDLFPSLRSLLTRSAAALSGGEQQILALARAFARQPRLLLVDELSLGLAPGMVTELFDVLVCLSEESGVAVLFAEQHVGRALAVAHRAYVLAAGRVVLEGSAAELAAHPERVESAYLGDDTRLAE